MFSLFSIDCTNTNVAWRHGQRERVYWGLKCDHCFSKVFAKGNCLIVNQMKATRKKYGIISEALKVRSGEIFFGSTEGKAAVSKITKTGAQYFTEEGIKSRTLFLGLKVFSLSSGSVQNS